ncbi:hypothetical protein ACWEWU_09470 [Staphylococcus xylosus]
MRYDERVIFEIEHAVKYNPKTSKREKYSTFSEVIACNVNPISRARKQLEFGEVENDVSVLRIIRHLTFKPTHLTVNGIRYKILDTRIYRKETIFYIEEVN